MAEPLRDYLVDGVKLIRHDGMAGWERRDGQWVTAVKAGRPKGSPCTYMDDRTMLWLIEEGEAFSTNWSLLGADGKVIPRGKELDAG